MTDKTDISREKKLFYKERAETVIKNLKKRQINGLYAADRCEALAAAMAMIPPGAVVARGDSLSLDQVGVLDELRKRGQNKMIDPFEKKADGSMLHKFEDRHFTDKDSFDSDVYLAGTNAITLDGKIVNTDGNGNRVAMMIFGPRKVILVVGANKIVSNEEEARQRIREIAAPLNALRHYTMHSRTDFGSLPCVVTGQCADCSNKARLCHYTVIIEGVHFRHTERLHVILVGEELGM